MDKKKKKMINEKFLEVKRKFEQDDNITGEKLAEALIDYIDAFTDEVEHNIKKERESGVKPVLKVVNALIDDGQQNKYILKHMYPVLNNKEASVIKMEKNDAGVVERLNSEIAERINSKNSKDLGSVSRVKAGYLFLNTTYDESELLNGKKCMLSLADKMGKEYEIPYYLFRSDLLIKECKKLWRLSTLYGDESPILYAPYSSRFFEIAVDVESILSIDNFNISTIDFRFADNELLDKICLNKVMVWNVRKEEAGVEIEPKQSPKGDTIHWKYHFSNLLSNQYIMPKNDTWPTFQLRIFSAKELEFDFENIERGGFIKRSIYEIKDNDFEGVDLYKPSYNIENLDEQPRVRSITDIHYELNKFKQYPEVYISKMYIKEQEISKKRKIKRLGTNMTIYDRGRFGYKNTNHVFIEFSGDTEYIFFMDYADFVLGVLTYLYPEVGWKGVY